MTEFQRLEADVAQASAEPSPTSLDSDFSGNPSEKHSSILLSMFGTSTLCSQVCQLSRGNWRRVALLCRELSVVANNSCRKEFFVFPSHLLLFHLCLLTMMLNLLSTEAQNLSIPGLSKRSQIIIYVAPLFHFS